jgi:hypothetical protein
MPYLCGVVAFRKRLFKRKRKRGEKEMKLFGFRINAGEIKDVREIEKTLENIEEKKNKIIDLAGQLSTLTEIKFKYSADGSIEKKFEVDGFEMDKILGNMRVAQMQIVDSYKSLEALGMIEITPAPKNRGKTLLGKSIQEFFS